VSHLSVVLNGLSKKPAQIYGYFSILPNFGRKKMLSSYTPEASMTQREINQTELLSREVIEVPS